MAIFANYNGFLMRSFFTIILLFAAFCSYGANTQLDLPKDYQVFEKAGKKGLKNRSGEIIIPAAYEEVGWSRGELEVVKGTIGFKLNDLWGLISLDNQKIIDAEYTRLYHAGQQMLAAAKHNTTTGRDYIGLISTSGEELLPFKYAHIKVEGLRAVVAKKQRNKYVYGLLNLKGDVVIPTQYKHIEVLSGLRFKVKNKENRTAIFDDQGNVIIDFLLDSISNFNGEYAVAYDNHRRGLIDKNGTLIIEPSYQGVRVANGDVETRAFNQWDIMGSDNSIKSTLRVEELKPFSKSLFLASANDWGWLIDNEGNQVTPASYNHIDTLTGNLATFRKGQKWGVLNKNGKVKLPAKFDSVVIDRQMIFGKSKGLWSLYDSFNVKKTQNYYQAIGRKTGRLFPVKKKEHWGFIDRYGEEVIHCVYEKVGKFKNDLVWVQFHGQKGVINRNGDWKVLPQKADAIQVLNNSYYISELKGLKKLKDFDGELIYFTENPIEIREDYLSSLSQMEASGRLTLAVR